MQVFLLLKFPYENFYFLFYNFYYLAGYGEKY
nr:MAG TPA: hypothetical protein [Caudoviricetes sp.]